MLGKLFYHEWKDTWRLMAILNGAVIVLSVLGMIFAATGNLSDIFERNNAGSIWVFMMYMSFIFVYVAGIFTLWIGTTLYFYIRFYRNMYTDQGYLMHTLPVNEHELIISKALVALIWKLIGMFVMTVGIGSIGLAFLASTGDFYNQLRIHGTDIFDTFVNGVYGGNGGLFTVYVLVMIFAGLGSLIYSIFMGYAAISFGQQAKKNKVLASIGIFFGINIGVSMITNMINQFIMLFAIRIDYEELFNRGGFGTVSIGTSLVTGIIVYVLAGLFYFATYRIMKNRLNLE